MLRGGPQTKQKRAPNQKMFNVLLRLFDLYSILSFHTCIDNSSQAAARKIQLKCSKVHLHASAMSCVMKGLIARSRSLDVPCFAPRRPSRKPQQGTTRLLLKAVSAGTWCYPLTQRCPAFALRRPSSTTQKGTNSQLQLQSFSLALCV